MPNLFPGAEDVASLLNRKFTCSSGGTDKAEVAASKMLELLVQDSDNLEGVKFLLGLSAAVPVAIPYLWRGTGTSTAKGEFTHSAGVGFEVNSSHAAGVVGGVAFDIGSNPFVTEYVKISAYVFVHNDSFQRVYQRDHTPVTGSFSLPLGLHYEAGATVVWDRGVPPADGDMVWVSWMPAPLPNFSFADVGKALTIADDGSGGATLAWV